MEYSDYKSALSIAVHFLDTTMREEITTMPIMVLSRWCSFSGMKGGLLMIACGLTEYSDERSALSLGRPGVVEVRLFGNSR